MSRKTKRGRKRRVKYSRCKTSGKRGYPNKFAALTVASRASSKYGNSQRVYRCPECLNWHLTHKPHRSEIGSD